MQYNNKILSDEELATLIAHPIDWNDETIDYDQVLNYMVKQTKCFTRRELKHTGLENYDVVCYTYNYTINDEMCKNKNYLVMRGCLLLTNKSTHKQYLFRGYDKFFNLNQVGAYDWSEDALLNKPWDELRVYNKLDGSLIAMRLIDNQPVYKSQNAMDNKYTREAQTLLAQNPTLNRQITPYLEQGYTIIFEYVNEDEHPIKYHPDVIVTGCRDEKGNLVDPHDLKIDPKYLAQNYLACLNHTYRKEHYNKFADLLDEHEWKSTVQLYNADGSLNTSVVLDQLKYLQDTVVNDEGLVVHLINHQNHLDQMLKVKTYGYLIQDTIFNEYNDDVYNNKRYSWVNLAKVLNGKIFLRDDRFSHVANSQELQASLQVYAVKDKLAQHDFNELNAILTNLQHQIYSLIAPYAEMYNEIMHKNNAFASILAMLNAFQTKHTFKPEFSKQLFTFMLTYFRFDCEHENVGFKAFLQTALNNSNSKENDTIINNYFLLSDQLTNVSLYQNAIDDVIKVTKTIIADDIVPIIERAKSKQR